MTPGAVLWPRAFGGVSPFWRDTGRAYRSDVRWASALAILVPTAAWSTVDSSVHGVARTLVSNVLLFAIPLWLVISVFVSALSAGAWSRRTDAALVWLVVVALPVGWLIAGGDPGLDLATFGLALGAAAAWMTGRDRSRRLRETVSRIRDP